MDLRYEWVAFDLYGTLLDVSGLADQMDAVSGEAEDAATAQPGSKAGASTDLPGGAAALLAAWRKAQLERTWKLNEQGAYEPFDVVTAKALFEVAPQLDP